MHYWSERRLNKATLHDVLTRCCRRGSAAEHKSNIPNQITPSISMFYYLFSHKHTQETRLCGCAERRPEGCWHDGKPTARLLWDWPLTLTGLYSLQQQNVDAGFSDFSGCLLPVPDLHLRFPQFSVYREPPPAIFNSGFVGNGSIFIAKSTPTTPLVLGIDLWSSVSAKSWGANEHSFHSGAANSAQQ